MNALQQRWSLPPREVARRRAPSPSPLHGERAGVRGGNVVALGEGGSRGRHHPSPSIPLPVEGSGRPDSERRFQNRRASGVPCAAALNPFGIKTRARFPAPTGRHSTAQGKALGQGTKHFSSPERASLGRRSCGSALSGLAPVASSNPGLCPGLSNDGPSGLAALAHVPGKFPRAGEEFPPAPEFFRTRENGSRRWAEVSRMCPEGFHMREKSFRLRREFSARGKKIPACAGEVSACGKRVSACGKTIPAGGNLPGTSVRTLEMGGLGWKWAGQPGGLSEISRGLSGATPPVGVHPSPAPRRGARDAGAARWIHGSGIPSGCGTPGGVTGGVVALRAPQPPANFWQPFRLRPLRACAGKWRGVKRPEGRAPGAQRIEVMDK